MPKTYSVTGIMVRLEFSESRSPPFIGLVRTEFLRARVSFLS